MLLYLNWNIIQLSRRKNFWCHSIEYKPALKLWPITLGPMFFWRHICVQILWVFIFWTLNVQKKSNCTNKLPWAKFWNKFDFFWQSNDYFHRKPHLNTNHFWNVCNRVKIIERYFQYCPIFIRINKIIINQVNKQQCWQTLIYLMFWQ